MESVQKARRPREHAQTRPGATATGTPAQARPVESVESTVLAEPSGAGRTLTLALPLIKLRLQAPRLGAWEVGRVIGAARSVLPQGRLAYYGGLGALVVLGLVEWPVAAAIGVGTVIVQRARETGRADPDLGRPENADGRTITSG
ncbi:hypothetical protein ACFOWE_31690 [Planomonospora corallina]|uniref:Uncharacterized protein n=1 Tax=Planomonospora corallina TaxID=1806052 RepID=A0ABV8IIQ2_9ACTN